MEARRQFMIELAKCYVTLHSLFQILIVAHGGGGSNSALPLWTLFSIFKHTDLLYQQVLTEILFFVQFYRGKSLQDFRGAAFVYDWQPSLIFVRFTSNFLYMCSTIGTHAQEIWGKSDKD